MRGRYGRPGSLSFLLMIAVNAVLGTDMLWLVTRIFDIGQILPKRLASWSWAQEAAKWDTLWPMLPGAGLGFACLWYWLVLTGRSKGIAWGGALIYGGLIACGDVILGGFLSGLVNGNPLLGMLIGLAILLVIPTLLLAMVTFGAIMGAFNGWAARRWIEIFPPAR